MSWTGNEWTIYFTMTPEEMVFTKPLTFQLGVNYVSQFQGKWVDLSVSAGTDPDHLVTVHSGLTLDHTGVYTIPIEPSLFAPGQNVIRLRGLTIDQMGYGVIAPVAVFGEMALLFTGVTPPSLTDVQLLDQTEARGESLA